MTTGRIPFTDTSPAYADLLLAEADAIFEQTGGITFCVPEYDVQLAVWRAQAPGIVHGVDEVPFEAGDVLIAHLDFSDAVFVGKALPELRTALLDVFDKISMAGLEGFDSFKESLEIRSGDDFLFLVEDMAPAFFEAIKA